MVLTNAHIRYLWCAMLCMPSPCPLRSVLCACTIPHTKPLCLASRIAEGNFYEAHQQLRVITARYLKASDYESACDVLYNGSLLLLRAGQGGSGGDLALMLLNDVYTKGEWACTDENRRRLLEILRAFPPDEPTRKRFINETVAWSGKFGEVERGDAVVHHEVGKMLAEGPSLLLPLEVALRTSSKFLF